MLALIGFIAMLINVYIWIIIAGAVLSWLVAFKVVNTHNQFVYTVADAIYRLTEPALRPIRRFLPDLGGIDISPIVLIFGLIFLREVVLFGFIAPLFMPTYQPMGGADGAITIQ